MFCDELDALTHDDLADFAAMSQKYNSLLQWFSARMDDMNIDIYLKYCIGGSIVDEFDAIFKSIQNELYLRMLTDQSTSAYPP
jgi:hypothetical protein